MDKSRLEISSPRVAALLSCKLHMGWAELVTCLLSSVWTSVQATFNAGKEKSPVANEILIRSTNWVGC